MKSLYLLQPQSQALFAQVAASVRAGVQEAANRMTDDEIKQLVVNPYDELAAEQQLRQAA